LHQQFSVSKSRPSQRQRNRWKFGKPETNLQPELPALPNHVASPILAGEKTEKSREIFCETSSSLKKNVLNKNYKFNTG
jgi:hypothetical protein